MPSSLRRLLATARDWVRSGDESDGARRSLVSGVTWGLFLVAASVFFVGLAAAGNGLTLSKDPRDTLAIPQWLYMMTGSAAIGISALLASFITDRTFINRLEQARRSPIKNSDTVAWVGKIAGVGGVGLLGLGLYAGIAGPSLPTANVLVLLTFAGMRAGLPIVTYLLGDVWPVLNPWRAIAEALPAGFVTYPASVRRWPAVVAVLTLVWVELIVPISTVPSTLAVVVGVYTVVTVAGAVVFGPASWFRNVDPWSVMFRLFGAVAPFQRDGTGISLRLPGSGLTEPGGVTHVSDIAFVVALIWELTYSGFLTTQVGAATIRTLTTALHSGWVPIQYTAIAVYTLLFVSGFGAFFLSYWYASRLSHARTETYIDATEIALRFAPPLIAIAAGYHFAHYAELFVTLSPALIGGLTAPLSPPANPSILSAPAWFDGVKIAAVLLGHLVAVFAAHAVAYDTFSSRMVAIRSQYPFIVVMIGYTAVSLWILSLAGGIPPYLA